MKFDKKQLQTIINDKSQKWGITESVLTEALQYIAEFDQKENKRNVTQIYSKSVLRAYLRKIHAQDRRDFVSTGDKERLYKVYEVFPVGKDGRDDVSELMTWKKAFKDKRVLWNTIANRQNCGVDRAYSAAETMTAFADLASGMVK